MNHRDQVLALLQKQIGNPAEVREIRETAEEVVKKWVNPLSGGQEEINGLIYGLVQSGKTGVLTVTGAMGADEGYRTIIILTSDNDPLYEQTLGRAQEAFPGIDMATRLKQKHPTTVKRLRAAYDDLASTHTALKNTSFDELIEAIGFFSPGITVKLVNGETDEDVAVRSPYNLFVGGNKLGRGVTIKNLLVSYYGRNPRAPQADTVLQHARMYGYRRKDIGLLRLFLPPQLHLVFRAINKMERALRDLIARNPSEEFRGIYVEGGLNATRRNVLAPGAIGVYSAGSIYNPAQVVRDESVDRSTTKIDKMLDGIGKKSYAEVPIDEMRTLIALTMPDQGVSERVWDALAVGESLAQFAKLHQQKTGFVYVDRGRGLKQNRRETQGILDGGEAGTVPRDKITLFMLRTDTSGGDHAAWWPQIRFPDGRYAFAFAV